MAERGDSARLEVLSVEPSIRQLSRREVYRNKWMRLYEDQIERVDLATGACTPGIYAVMEKEPAAIIVPLERDAAGSEFVYLIEQFRYTVGARYFEFPQGAWEVDDADPEELARGELAEETGLRAGRMTRLGSQWIAYGAMRQIHHVFLAEDLTAGELDRDAEEHDLVLRRVNVAEFEQMMLDGRVMDNCTCAAWGQYLVWRRARG
jgi:8-oxo-dGTP pyrophosphatase MutT (NUDIX family)